MAGLARDTDRIGLGVLVSPVTFRHPGTFAKVVTTVDEMSGGRIEVGVGAGWNELEHRQLGLAFPPINDAGRPAWRTSSRSCTGCGASPTAGRTTGHQVSIQRGADFDPKPVDVPGRPRTAIGGARPRIMVGGQGSPRSYPARGPLRRRVQPQLVGPDKAREAFAELDDACRAIGRDPTTLARSTMAGVLIGRDEAEMARRRAAAIGAFGARRSTGAWLDERLERWVAGTPDEARAMVARFAEAGHRADHAPGLPALGPRHDRRHGRGPRRPGLRPVASVAGGVRRGAVGRIVAADEVGVRAARPREALGQQLERRRAARSAPRPVPGRCGASPTTRRPTGVSVGVDRGVGPVGEDGPDAEYR